MGKFEVGESVKVHFKQPKKKIITNFLKFEVGESVRVHFKQTQNYVFPK